MMSNTKEEEFHMVLSREEILRRFSDKCRELGGDPDIETMGGLCEGLPSVKEAIELRNFTGELIKSAPEGARFGFGIKANHEDHDYVEVINVFGKGDIEHRVYYYKFLEDLPGDLENEMKKLPYRKRMDIEFEISDRINRERRDRLLEIIKNAGFKKTDVGDARSSYWSIVVLVKPRAYRSSDEFLKRTRSIRKLVEEIDEEAKAVRSMRDKTVREVIDNLKKGLQPVLHKKVYIEE